MIPPTCPYCGNPAELTEPWPGRFTWSCDPCQAWVGVHKNTHNHVPLGTLAKAELRELRKQVHKYFDPLWQGKMRRDQCSKSEARNAAYAWLAEQIGIDREECHVAMFDEATCERALEIIQGIGRKG